MQMILISIFFLAFLIRTVRNALYQTFLWQLKEYRFDRMRAHLKTWQGKRMVFGLVSLAKFALMGSYLLGWSVFWPAFFVYLTEAIWEFREFKVFGWKRPVWTLKAISITSTIILGSLGGLTIIKSWVDWAFWLLVLDKLLAPAIAVLVLIFSFPTQIQKYLVIEKAKKMIKSRPDLITIGITGSYGKTSTKEFLAQILSSKFRVLKTGGSQNTMIGVAKTIVERLKDQEVFVCEMGAYKIGEIKQICQICKPKIGIITGINEQHLDLFGSLEKTIEAKYELIESLPEDGLAVFNGNNQYCLEMVKKTQTLRLKTILYYCTMTIRQKETGFYADKIKIFPGKLDFEVICKNKKQRMTTQLLGKQNVENILGAILVANHLEMSLEEIAKAVSKLEPPEMTMKLVLRKLACPQRFAQLGGRGGLGSLVDDSFNANPDGVLAAIEYMKVYSGKKILVLTPMIELGEKASEAHRKVGKLAGEVCDLIILTNKNYYEDFMKGFEGNVRVRGRVWISQGKEAAKRIKDLLGKDGVAVFEGKEAGRILND